MDGLCELHLLGREVLLGVVGQQTRQDQQAVERSTQLVRHVRQELRLVLGGDLKLMGPLLQGVPGTLDLLVLQFDGTVLVGQLGGLLTQLGVLSAQLLLLALQLVRAFPQLAGELLRLLQQVFGAIVGQDRVDRGAQQRRELAQEVLVDLVEPVVGGELQHTQRTFLGDDRKDVQVTRRRLTQRRTDRHVPVRDVVDDLLHLLREGLTGQPLALPEDAPVIRRLVTEARVEPENVLLVHVRRQVAGPVLGPHQRRHLGHDEAGQLVEVPVSLQVSGDAVEVGLEPVGVPLGLGGLAQVGHHQVDVVLEFFHLAAGVDLDVAGQVALGHGVGDLGDRTDLCGQIAGQTVHAVGELLPGARDPFDLGLTTQLALVADLVGHPGHLGGERRQLVHHRVDGRLDLENLALGVDVDLLGQVTGRDRGRDLGDVAHLRGEVVRHRVDVLGEVLPDAEHALDVGTATQLALGAHLTCHPGHFVGERRQLVHHHVDGVLEFQDLALGVDRDLLGQVSAGDRSRDHGDLADLVGQVVGHGVDVVGQVLPDP